MTSVVKGFGNGNGTGSGSSSGTHFTTMLSPPGDALKDYDKTKSQSRQEITLPQTFQDIMSIREEVSGEQKTPWETDFDDDDARSWHWVSYASIAVTSSSPSPPSLRPTRPDSKAEEERRSSATAQSLGVCTVRLVPPPHQPSTHNPNLQLPAEPYIQLGRLTVRKEFAEFGLCNPVIDAALKWAAKNPDTITPPPPPTTLEFATQLGATDPDLEMWKGLTLVITEVKHKGRWETHGFSEELLNENGKVEIAAQPPWKEDGIEHVAMWKRIRLDPGRL